MAKGPFQAHPSDDQLELYALGRLSASANDHIEEHLLICYGCQDRLIDLDSYLHLMKQVCALEVETRAAHQRSISKAVIAIVMRVPVPVWAGTMALLAVSAGVPLIRSVSAGPETEIHLVASRGGELPARAGRNVRMTIDAAELESFPSYRVAVVDPSGQNVWAGTVKPANAVLTVRPNVRLAAGTYWVRVTGPNAEPVREYGLKLN